MQGCAVASLLPFRSDRCVALHAHCCTSRACPLSPVPVRPPSQGLHTSRRASFSLPPGVAFSCAGQEAGAAEALLQGGHQVPLWWVPSGPGSNRSPRHWARTRCMCWNATLRVAHAANAAAPLPTRAAAVMMKHGYIGEFEFVDNHRSGKIVVELNGRWALWCCQIVWGIHLVGLGRPDGVRYVFGVASPDQLPFKPSRVKSMIMLARNYA